MHYLSYIPETITPITKCIIMLHGVGSNEQDLFALSDRFSEDAMIISLQGPFSLGGGRYAWYPVDFSTGKAVYRPQDVERGYEEIFSCITEVTEKYDIKSENIFLMGFSQGAIMSYYTFWKSSETIGGIIALSGRIISEIDRGDIPREKYRGKKVFIAHGERDGVIPYLESEKAQDYIRTMGIVPTFHSYNAPHSITEGEIADILSWIRR